MKQLILDLIKDKPRHFSGYIKRDTEMYNWVIQNSVATSDKFIDHIFSAISKKDNICQYNNQRRFISINSDDFGFCGRAAKCQCCKASVSESIKQYKMTITTEQQNEINRKREETWKKLSNGKITNAGQTASAISTRIKLNQDNDYKQMVVEKRKATCIEKFGADNIKSINPYLNQLRDKGLCESLYAKYDRSMHKLVEVTELSEKTIRIYLHAHEIIDKKKTIGEIEIFDYLKSLGITEDEIIIGDRKILNGKELDFYLPKYNLAIEYNGVHWHAESEYNLRIDKNYHLNKVKECNSKGILLLHVYCFQWQYKNQIVKNRIKTKLQLNNHRIFARKTIIREIPNSEYQNFLKTYHIQGSVVSAVKIGLFSGDNLVAVIGFSKSRSIIGKKNTDDENTWELLRYCSVGVVVGGLSKLLTYFKKLYKPTLIRTFSDNSWNTGKSYEVVGFKKVKETTPGYWYYKIGDTSMQHRSNFTKKKLIKLGFDHNSTESEIMKQMKYYKLWDCGNSVWELE